MLKEGIIEENHINRLLKFATIQQLEFPMPPLLRHKNLDDDISGTKRATGDPLVSKRPDFQGLFRFANKCILGFLDFVVFFLDYWQYLRNKKSYPRPAGVKTT